MTSKRRTTYTRRPYLAKRENGNYRIHHQHNGRQVRISTKTKIRYQADAALDRYIRDLSNGISLDTTTMTMHHGIANWLEDRQSPRNGLKTRTLIGYKTFAKKLTSVIPQGLLVRDFHRMHVRNALDKLAHAGESQIQIAKCQTVLSQVCNFLIAEGHMTHNPSVKVAPAAQYNTQVAMRESDYLALLQALQRECAKPSNAKCVVNLRDLVELCWHTGFRFIEWTRIKWSDVDFEQQAVTTHSPKNKGGTRTRPLAGSAFRVLQRRRQLGGKVFPGTYAGMMTAWRRFRARHPEFADARFHGMRRAFITRIHHEHGSAAAMALAGHSSPIMTGLYTDPTQLDLHEKLREM
jgi:integrase